MSSFGRPIHVSANSQGFTLIEVLVAVAILALMTSLIVPQFAGNDRRTFRAAVDATADMLTMYAQRETLAQKVIGLSHDRTQNWLVLTEIDVEPGAPSGAWQWRNVPFIEPVKLPKFMTEADVQIFADGARYDAAEWPLFNEIGKPRPHIEILLTGEGETALISLSPHGVSPTVDLGGRTTGVVRQRVDLDGAGRTREDW